jgi:hypothetical protein
MVRRPAALATAANPALSNPTDNPHPGRSWAACSSDHSAVDLKCGSTSMI